MRMISALTVGLRFLETPTMVASARTAVTFFGKPRETLFSTSIDTP